MGSKAQSPGDLLKTMWLVIAEELCQWKMVRKGPGEGWGTYLANAIPQPRALTSLHFTVPGDSKRPARQRRETGCWERGLRTDFTTQVNSGVLEGNGMGVPSICYAHRSPSLPETSNGLSPLGTGFLQVREGGQAQDSAQFSGKLRECAPLLSNCKMFLFGLPAPHLLSYLGRLCGLGVTCLWL